MKSRRLRHIEPQCDGPGNAYATIFVLKRLTIPGLPPAAMTTNCRELTGDRNVYMPRRKRH